MQLCKETQTELQVICGNVGKDQAILFTNTGLR